MSQTQTSKCQRHIYFELMDLGGGLDVPLTSSIWCEEGKIWKPELKLTCTKLKNYPASLIKNRHFNTMFIITLLVKLNN